MAERAGAKFSPELEAELAEISLGLEGLTEGARQIFLDGLDDVLSGLGQCELVLAPVAGKNVCELQLPTGWVSELRAAAARARESDS